MSDSGEARCKLAANLLGHSPATHGMGCDGCDEKHAAMLHKHAGRVAGVTDNHQAGWCKEWGIHRYGNAKVPRWRACGPWRETLAEAERDMQHGLSADSGSEVKR